MEEGLSSIVYIITPRRELRVFCCHERYSHHAGSLKVCREPNPMVGAVLIKEGRIVGKGFHRGPGKPHAEIEALHSAGKKAQGATLYVNLEPCCHYGKTPPCTDAIISAGLRKAAYSVKDPNPSVNGQGAKILKKYGIKVESGALEKEARRLNEAYFKYRLTGLPLVVLKLVQTLDGKMTSAIPENLTDRISHLLKTDAVLKSPRRTKDELLNLLKKLPEKGVLSVLVDGSGSLGKQLLQHRLVDKLYTFVTFEVGGKAPVLEVDLGVRKISQALKLREVERKVLPQGLLISGYLNYN